MAVTKEEFAAMQKRIGRSKGRAIVLEERPEPKPPKQTKKRTNDESRLQKACVKWFRTQYPKHILFAIPNGGSRGKIEGAILKAEGVLAGVPDLFLAVPNEAEHYSGLFLEMKTEDGVLSANQKAIMPQLKDAGYKVVICRSFDAFKSAIHDYLIT
jgi:hypothetical protein